MSLSLLVDGLVAAHPMQTLGLRACAGAMDRLIFEDTPLLRGSRSAIAPNWAWSFMG